MVQALILMFAGMSAVFLFLSLLVFCTATMSALVIRLQPQQDSVAQIVMQPATSAPVSHPDDEMHTLHKRRRAAAITAALIHHRARQMAIRRARR